MKEKVFNPPLVYNIPPPSDKTNVANYSNIEQTSILPYKQFRVQGLANASSGVIVFNSKKDIMITKVHWFGVNQVSTNTIRFFSVNSLTLSQAEMFLFYQVAPTTAQKTDTQDFNPPLRINTQNGLLYVAMDCDNVGAGGCISMSMFGFEIEP